MLITDLQGKRFRILQSIGLCQPVKVRPSEVASIIVPSSVQLTLLVTQGKV